MGGVLLGRGTFLEALIGQVALRANSDTILSRLESTRTERGWQVGAGFALGLKE